VTSEKRSAFVKAAVHAALREALEVDEPEIVDRARIMTDLGAESIDLLDIRFRLEHALGIKVSDEEFVRAFSKARNTQEFAEAFTVAALCALLITRMESANE
jgi:acyl carrier protein